MSIRKNSMAPKFLGTRRVSVDVVDVGGCALGNPDKRETDKSWDQGRPMYCKLHT